MSEYIKISDVIKICKSLYSSYGTTAFFNAPVFEDLLRTVAVELPKPPEVTWVSVKDRLPNRFEDVVVCTVSGGFDIGYIDTNGLWSTECTDSIITHWMPLPSTEGEQR